MLKNRCHPQPVANSRRPKKDLPKSCFFVFFPPAPPLGPLWAGRPPFWTSVTPFCDPPGSIVDPPEVFLGNSFETFLERFWNMVGTCLEHVFGTLFLFSFSPRYPVFLPPAFSTLCIFLFLRSFSSPSSSSRSTRCLFSFFLLSFLLLSFDVLPSLFLQSFSLPLPSSLYASPLSLSPSSLYLLSFFLHSCGGSSSGM